MVIYQAFQLKSPRASKVCCALVLHVCALLCTLTHRTLGGREHTVCTGVTVCVARDTAGHAGVDGGGAPDATADAQRSLGCVAANAAGHLGRRRPPGRVLPGGQQVNGIGQNLWCRSSTVFERKCCIRRRYGMGALYACTGQTWQTYL